eukprot:4874882-Pyramimonas_sp.AAC.1
MGREPQEKGQGEDREGLPDSPTKPTGDATPGTVSRPHWEECEDSRESEEEGGPKAGEETIEETIDGAAE